MPSDDSLPVLLNIFDTWESRLAVVVEVVVLAIIDGDYHELEDIFANDVIQEFQLSQNDHDRVNRIAEQAAAAVVAMWEMSEESA